MTALTGIAALDAVSVEIQIDDVDDLAPQARPISRAAQYITDTIKRGIKEALPDLPDEPDVNAAIVQDMIDGAFYSGARSKVFLLTREENLVQFGTPESWKFLCRRFGKPVDVDAIVAKVEAALADMAGDDADGAALTKTDRANIIKAIQKAVVDPILDHLNFENQRDQLEWAVDMFADTAKIELNEDVARIVLTHRPLDETGPLDQTVIDDYRAHFPQFDQVMNFVVASRFALDRKKSYLWLLAASDWGKGFLLGAFKAHGLAVELSVREIEGIFEGRPSGRSPADFKRAFIIAVDEFKSVKSELKQLQSEISIAPKYQLTAKVEIFTKLFLSAESVGSLVTENGVEDQFANRMSMITGGGTLNERAVYHADQSLYFRTIKTFIGQSINGLVAEYRALGREGSEQRANRVLDAFIGEHGLDQHFQRLSDNYPDIARQAVAWLRQRHPDKITYADGAEYVRHAAKVIDDFLKDSFTFSEVGTLSRRKPEIMAAMSKDGRGYTTHRIAGKLTKSIELGADM